MHAYEITLGSAALDDFKYHALNELPEQIATAKYRCRMVRRGQQPPSWPGVTRSGSTARPARQSVRNSGGR
ncbi:MAG: hypothetical protein JOZ49_03850 [Mycolicibacterium sp.]|nr:hypothetical protein [Mycolicibacterium sp.]